MGLAWQRGSTAAAELAVAGVAETGNDEREVVQVIVDGGGDYVAHIEGIDSNARGDLSFTDVRVGQSDTLNVFVDEGNVLRENANGSGFVAVGADGTAYITGGILGKFENVPTVPYLPCQVIPGPGSGLPQSEDAGPPAYPGAG